MDRGFHVVDKVLDLGQQILGPAPREGHEPLDLDSGLLEIQDGVAGGILRNASTTRIRTGGE